VSVAFLSKLEICIAAIKARWLLWILVTIGFIVFYYIGLLLITMLRFSEIPNYVEFYNIPLVYAQIFAGTPSLTDALFILVDEAWFETGYKNPEYYGIATWSYMLIPPKMFLVGLTGLLLSTLTVLHLHSKKLSCPVQNSKQMYTTAGIGTGLVGLTSATLTWVVCCATPSWIVGLAMLGISSSFVLLIEPFGIAINIIGMAMIVWIIHKQVSNIANNNTALPRMT